MTTARTDRWRFDRDLLAIVEDEPGGLALFEVLSATSFAQATAASLAPELVEVLRLVIQFENDETGDNDFCECDGGHEQAGTVCRSCFALTAARALLARLDREANGRG